MANRTIILLTVIGALFGHFTNSLAANENVVSQIKNSTVCIISADGGGGGTGIVTRINGKKYILTANHVIRGEQYVRIVSLKDGRKAYVNRTVGWHLKHDVALFALPDTLRHLPALPLLKGTLSQGTKVFLTGYPAGYYHLTEGKVSGFIKSGDEMLHTAASEGGASGGAIVSEKGDICGIHTGAYTPRSKYYPNKTATPSSVINRLLQSCAR